MAIQLSGELIRGLVLDQNRVSKVAQKSVSHYYIYDKDRMAMATDLVARGCEWDEYNNRWVVPSEVAYNELREFFSNDDLALLSSLTFSCE